MNTLLYNWKVTCAIMYRWAWLFNQEGMFLWLNIRMAVLPSILSQGLFIPGFQNEEWEGIGMTCADL